MSNTDNLVRATSACFIAVYVLAVYSATRILDGRLRALAWVTLAMVLVLAVFSTWYLAVPVVAAADLGRDCTGTIAEAAGLGPPFAMLKRIEIPVADPGNPDTRSPVRLLVWVGKHQKRHARARDLLRDLVDARAGADARSRSAARSSSGSSRARTATSRSGRSRCWRSALMQAFAGVMRHRYAVFNWLQASFRLAQLVAHHAARTGPAVRGALSTGEVVATVSNDAMRAGGAYDITARLSGAVVAYVVVGVILVSSSVVLGLIVLIGVPVLVLLLGGIIKPLQARQRDQREEVGKLTALGADTAAGLRVLRGIGGEQAFFDRYRRRSQHVRTAGVRVAMPQSTLDASQVFIPGLFVVFVTWIGARFALSGKIDTGELVAFYGYAAFLVIPLRTSAEAVDKITRALVGARRMLSVLAVERARRRPGVARRAEPPAGVRPRRPALGARRAAGPAHLPRLGAARRDGGDRRPARPLRRRGRRRARRRAARRPAGRRQSAAGSSSARPTRCSSPGRSATSSTRGAARTATTPDPRRPISVANAEDILDALPEGLDAPVDERGRSFSGGQRQRLVLARALLSDAEVLVLVEPTSAVDAHTEARIADRLREARAGRTTVIVTSSPLVLDRADRVVFVRRRAAPSPRGRTASCCARRPDYREVVTRG